MDLPKLGIPRGRGMNTNGATILLLHVAPKSIRDYKCAPKFFTGATLLLRATSEHQSDMWMEWGLTLQVVLVVLREQVVP